MTTGCLLNNFLPKLPMLRRITRLILLKPSHYSTKIKDLEMRSIYISTSKDIFTNLALEDWFYKNIDFSKTRILMLWQSDPCVVIGRHQNPWLECNFAELPNITENGVKLARRNSGGGTVYHDLGNLNLTFFTSREKYSRKENLELISRALNATFDINICISPREDLCIDDYKVSGTASKLGRTAAYHHCTLLIDVNKDNLSRALKNTLIDVQTNATTSIKSKITNLVDANPDITVGSAMDIIAVKYTTSNSPHLKIITDDEANFPGLEDIKNHYLSYEWIYQKTPKFQIFRRIQNGVKVVMQIENGTVKSVTCSDFGEFSDLFSDLISKRFSKAVLDDFELLVSIMRNTEKIVNR